MRNYAVLHIVADEAKIFPTKERAPLLLCFECYRPEELQLAKGGEKRRKQSNSFRGGERPKSITGSKVSKANSDDLELSLAKGIKRSKVGTVIDSVTRGKRKNSTK